MSENTINIKEQPKKLGALGLLKKIFAERNAALNPMDDGRLGFSYGYGNNQSENFVVEADDEHANIRVVDYCWHEVSKWDIEEVTRLQTQINICNTMARSKVVYHFDDDDKMVLSTMMTFPMFPEIQNLGDYFTAQLENMVQTHDFVLGKKEEKAEESEQTNEVSTDNEEGGKA